MFKNKTKENEGPPQELFRPFRTTQERTRSRTSNNNRTFGAPLSPDPLTPIRPTTQPAPPPPARPASLTPGHVCPTVPIRFDDSNR